MNKLFFACVFTLAATVNASETPKENQPDKSSVPAQVQELTSEEKSILTKAAPLEQCAILQIALEQRSLSKEDQKKAQDLFKKCSENKYYDGYILRAKLDRILISWDPSENNATRNFLTQPEFVNTDVAKFLKDLYAKDKTLDTL